MDIDPPGYDALVVGCGNLLRGTTVWVPFWCATFGTAAYPTVRGWSTAEPLGWTSHSKMRGAARVVIVDASMTGAAPGTVYRVPGEELADLPPLQGLHTHSFRWDHAIPFARWALGDACPTDITVFLIEAADVEMGAELSEPVQTAMEQVIEAIGGTSSPRCAPRRRTASVSRSPPRDTCGWTQAWPPAGFPPTRWRQCCATTRCG